MIDQVCGQHCPGSAYAFTAMNNHGFGLSISFFNKLNDFVQLNGRGSAGDVGVHVIEAQSIYVLGVERSTGQGDDGFEPCILQGVQFTFRFWPSAARELRFDEPTEVLRKGGSITQTSPAPGNCFPL